MKGPIFSRRAAARVQGVLMFWRHVATMPLSVNIRSQGVVCHVEPVEANDSFAPLFIHAQAQMGNCSELGTGTAICLL